MYDSLQAHMAPTAVPLYPTRCLKSYSVKPKSGNEEEYDMYVQIRYQEEERRADSTPSGRAPRNVPIQRCKMPY